MTDRLLRCLYSTSASSNNQSQASVTSHDIWKFWTELHYRSAPTDISPGNYHL